jgi:hypothetical protein
MWGATGSSVSMPAAPVSPGFSAMPVSGYTAAPDGPVAGYAASPNVYGAQPPGVPRSAHPNAPSSAPPGAPWSAPPAAPATGGSVGAGGRGRRTGVIAALAVVLLLVVGLGVYGWTKFGDDDNGGSDGGGPQSSGDGHVAADVEHPDTDWTSSAEEYDTKAGTTIGYQCSENGTIITVWGSGPYTSDSSVCTAAVHAGLITLENGGRVVIKIEQGAATYEGTTRHGIVTTSYDAFPWAFEFVT